MNNRSRLNAKCYRKLQDDGVKAHLMRGPYIMFLEPMMEKAGWRANLQ